MVSLCNVKLPFDILMILILTYFTKSQFVQEFSERPTVKLAVAEPEQRAIFTPQICTVFVQSLCINTLPAAMSHGGLNPFRELALLFLAITTYYT